MIKKLLAGAILLLAVIAIGLFVWVRSLFANDTVRLALAEQLSKSLGQPVKVGGITVGIYPRVAVNLRDVAIGEPARIQTGSLKLGAALGALLSRRLEHATIELDGARVELPLPAFAVADAAPASTPGSKPPIDIVSVDAIVLKDVKVVSGGRTLSGDVEVVPQNNGLEIRKIALATDKTTVDITGRLTDLTGPVGEIAIKAAGLNFDQLLAFATDFANGSGLATANSSSASRPSAPTARSTAGGAMNIAVSLEADRASMGALALDKLAGKARITNTALTLQPVSFGVFGGRYEGSLAFALASTPEFKLNATLTGIDVGAATAFAGSPGTMTGRLSGRLELAGRGMDAPTVMRGARGTLRVDVVNGSVKNLGLIRTIVVATSGRSDATMAGATRDEPFTKLGATLAIANGSASTQDLRFESKDLLLAAAGTMRLDGSAINLPGQVQLSDELSKQAGRDLVRYTQNQGRVTLPATITGSADAPHVRVDVADMAKRAVTNRATEEAQKVLKKGLGGLFKKK